ncbi:MAG: hypothetical protein JSR90_00895 [Proteobacteria bacterium]|nr:hypothetical protein [Pseudomonadota bacterium]
MAASIRPVPLFDSAVHPDLLWPRSAPWPRRRARAVLRRFQIAFPELEYDIDLDVPLANAQAFLEDGVRRVRLYGGLVRHRLIGMEGIAVVLGHETGHHLGGAPFHEQLKWLSSETRADAWAATVGLRKVFGTSGARRITVSGTKQLNEIKASQ